MNINEFRTLTGQEVTESEFADITKLYMATGNMNKQTFCGLWKKNDLFSIALEVERNLSAKVTFAEKVLAKQRARARRHGRPTGSRTRDHEPRG